MCCQSMLPEHLRHDLLAVRWSVRASHSDVPCVMVLFVLGEAERALALAEPARGRLVDLIAVLGRQGVHFRLHIY